MKNPHAAPITRADTEEAIKHAQSFRRLLKNPHAVALGKLGGKVGGKSKSQKKIEAVRENGKRGGRPKK